MDYDYFKDLIKGFRKKRATQKELKMLTFPGVRCKQKTE